MQKMVAKLAKSGHSLFLTCSRRRSLARGTYRGRRRGLDRIQASPFHHRIWGDSIGIRESGPTVWDSS